MKTIGQRLKYKRESLGMTLLDIEKKIKVQRKYIEMIEKDDFDSLPNKAYAIGIIKAYARSVNMNPDAFLKDHASELPSTESSAKIARNQLKHVTHNAGETKTVKPLLIGILIALLTVSVIWFLTAKVFLKDTSGGWIAKDINESRNVKVKPAADDEKLKDSKTNDKKSKTAKKEEDKAPQNKVQVKYRSFDGAALSYDVIISEPLVLDVKSKANTWIQVFDDKGKRYAYEEVMNKEMKIADQAKEVTLISGNSTSMDVYINGQKLEIPKTAENLITRTYLLSIDRTK